MQFPNQNPSGTVEKDRFHTGDRHKSSQFSERQILQAMDSRSFILILNKVLEQTTRRLTSECPKEGTVAAWSRTDFPRGSRLRITSFHHVIIKLLTSYNRDIGSLDIVQILMKRQKIKNLILVQE